MTTKGWTTNETFYFEGQKVLSGFLCHVSIHVLFTMNPVYEFLELSPIRTDVQGTTKTDHDCVSLWIFSDCHGSPPTTTSPAPACLCTPTMNWFTIYNYLCFSVIYKQEHSNKRGIKLGLFSHSKNKNDTISVFRVSKKPHQRLFSWKFFIYILVFQLRTKPY